MRRLGGVTVSGRVDLRPMIARRVWLGRIGEARDLLSHQRVGVPKVATTP
jgi:hypothetical protein